MARVTAKRGKVLRDPIAGPGLLIVEGQQYQFSMEGVWKSEVPAKPGLAVDVEFGPNNTVIGIIAVPESQLAKEQADQAMAEKGGQIAGQMVPKFSMNSLIAGGLLIISWFFLTAVSVELPFLGTLKYSFWEVLGFLNSSNILEALNTRKHPSAGFYGFLAMVALVGPFLHHFWKDKRAFLGGLLPLVFMAFVGLMIRSSISSTFGGGANDPQNIGQQMQDEAMKAISLGFGTYISVLVSLYFAAVGTKKFLAAKASVPGAQPQSQKVAA